MVVVIYPRGKDLGPYPVRGKGIAVGPFLLKGLAESSDPDVAPVTVRLDEHVADPSSSQEVCDVTAALVGEVVVANQPLNADTNNG